jgi:hypothetical protein
MPDHLSWTLADLRAALAPEERPACLRGYRPPVACESCGQPVEDDRRCYAHPTCYACLPPPSPLPALLDLEPCRYCGTLREVHTDPAPGYVCVQACDGCGDGMRLEMEEGGTNA